MYRVDVRPPAAICAFSSTTTTLATLTAPAVANRRINIVGYSIVYGTLPNTAVTPALSTSAGQLYIISTSNLSNTADTFFYPIAAQSNMAVKLQVTITAAALLSLSLLYFYD